MLAADRMSISGVPSSENKYGELTVFTSILCKMTIKDDDEE